MYFFVGCKSNSCGVFLTLEPYGCTVTPILPGREDREGITLT